MKPATKKDNQEKSIMLFGAMSLFAPIAEVRLFSGILRLTRKKVKYVMNLHVRIAMRFRLNAVLAKQ